MITFAVTAISAHLPPIRNESEEYYEGQEGDKEVEVNGSRFKAATTKRNANHMIRFHC